MSSDSPVLFYLVLKEGAFGLDDVEKNAA